MAPGSSVGQVVAREAPGLFLAPSRPRPLARPRQATARLGLAPNRTILDVSRLLSAVRRTTPSGIDRVEMAYVRHWLAAPSASAGFVAQNPFGRFTAIDRGALAELAAALAVAWSGGEGRGTALRRARGIALGMQAGISLGFGRRELATWLGPRQRTTLLIASHSALEAAPRIAALREAGARFVPFIHDLIPLSHPEYTRPRQVGRHLSRVATITGLADGLIVNSAATAAELAPQFDRAGRAMPPICVAPLGVESLAVPEGPAAAEPYFVCLGTIEPRKNHLLLLQIWREMAEQGLPDIPRLLLIGRRGWENEHILRMLDRCTALRGLVQELGPLPDTEARRDIAGACALLFPSFAEGYGLPLAEALALGVPAIAADLPALREVGGAVPDYLAPTDGAGWRRTILDYARPGSAARAAQRARMEGWRAPGWAAHFATVEAMLDQLATA